MVSNNDFSSLLRYVFYGERAHEKEPRPQGKCKATKEEGQVSNSRIFNKFYVYGRLALL